MLYVLMKIFSHPGAKNKNKTKRLNGLKFSTFIGRFQVTVIMAAKGLSFHRAQESVFASELERRVLGVYTDRHDDRYGGRIPSKKRKTKMAILEITFKKHTDRCSLFSSS